MNHTFSSKLNVPAAVSGSGLISSPALAAIRELAKSINAKSVVEVGSWCGLGSTLELAKAVGEDGLIVCVDSWPNAPDFGRFMANIAKEGVADRIMPLRIWSVSAAKMFKPESFDLVFIDGGHSYECVTTDIRTWLPLVRKGGILCGDDYNYPGDAVSRAVADTIGSVGVFAERIWSYRKP